MLLCPESRGEGVRRTVKYLCGLCVTLCLMMPVLRLPELSFDGSAEERKNEKQEEYTMQFARTRACQEIALYIRETYGITVTHIDITLDDDDPLALTVTSVSPYFDASVPPDLQQEITQDVSRRFMTPGKEIETDAHRGSTGETADGEGTAAPDRGTCGGDTIDPVGISE